jgi:hypothetical protein
MCRARYLDSVAQLDVAGRTGLSSHNNEIAKLSGARDTRLANNHTMAPHNDVVPDLYQIINFGPFTDDSILKCPSVDR